MVWVDLRARGLVLATLPLLFFERVIHFGAVLRIVVHHRFGHDQRSGTTQMVFVFNLDHAAFILDNVVETVGAKTVFSFPASRFRHFYMG